MTTKLFTKITAVRSEQARTWLRTAAVAGVAVSLFGLTSEIADADPLPPGTSTAGVIAMSPSTGDSATSFSLAFGAPPQNCPGDAIANWRWGTFITPISNDPGLMTYTPSGNPNGPAFTGALRDPIGTPARAQTPGIGDGLVVAPAGLTFESEAYAALAPGDYWIGIACTLPDTDDGVVETQKFWATAITITSTSGGGPNNLSFAAAAPPDTTTTTSTSTTTSTLAPGGSTTTTSSTTIAGATTTSSTVAGSSTSSTSSIASSTTLRPATTVASGAGSGTGSGSGGASGNLATTGSSSNVAMVVWAVLLLVFGRVAVLLSRKPQIRPANP